MVQFRHCHLRSGGSARSRRWSDDLEPRFGTCVLFPKGNRRLVVPHRDNGNGEVSNNVEKMMIREVRDFIARGNVIDLAVGIIIGAAFTAIVASIVEDLVNPLIGLIVGGIDFSSVSFGVGDAQFKVGNFINAVIKFLIIAWIVFLIVKAVNKMKDVAMKVEVVEPESEASKPPTTEELLAEIRDALKFGDRGGILLGPANLQVFFLVRRLSAVLLVWNLAHFFVHLVSCRRPGDLPSARQVTTLQRVRVTVA
jgi:large conductance mechanosensitive channel